VSTAKLLYQNESNRAQEFLLDSDHAITIGRHPDNHLVLTGNGISGYHIQIRRNGDRYFLADLESTHGTYLNGSRLSPKEPHPLKDRDIIIIGDQTLRFCAQSDSQQTQYVSGIPQERSVMKQLRA